MQYETKTFQIDNDDILWEKFMCFVREINLYEESDFSHLSEVQKVAVIAFLYSSEVIREGHIGFEDLYGKYISHSVIIASLKKICVSDKYLKIVEELPGKFIPVAEIADKCMSEEDFEIEMERINKIYDEFDNRFYQYGNEEIIDKILIYIRQYHLEFFKYI